MSPRPARGSSVLASGARSHTGRHATLRAAIDWSWEMLTPAERSTLAQCSIFAGGWTLEAAEAVVDLAHVPGAPAVIDVLAALREKSLVRAGAGRFSLYQSIREYAAEHVAALAEVTVLGARHRRYYLDATRHAFDSLRQTGDAASHATLLTESDNLLAIQRSLSARATLTSAEAAELARVVLHLEPIAEAEWPLADLVAMLDGGIDAAYAAGDERTRGRLLIARGNARGARGAHADALVDLEAARDLGRAHADMLLEGEALLFAGVRYRHQGRAEEARSAGEKAIALLEGTAMPHLEGVARAVFGLLLCELGQTEASRRENQRARGIFRAADDRWAEGLALANIAQIDQALEYSKAGTKQTFDVAKAA